jgi:hypothetical protein
MIGSHRTSFTGPRLKHEAAQAVQLRIAVEVPARIRFEAIKPVFSAPRSHRELSGVLSLRKPREREHQQCWSPYPGISCCRYTETNMSCVDRAPVLRGTGRNIPENFADAERHAHDLRETYVLAGRLSTVPVCATRIAAPDDSIEQDPIRFPPENQALSYPPDGFELLFPFKS